MVDSIWGFGGEPFSLSRRYGSESMTVIEVSPL
ncbi:hypothetical protein APT_00779 [Acetobacter pasteurianus NBRC 101655]|nr:hypothetical protein APT_00779 [Acetobacter pasteurianus NBRC 101655]